MWPQRPQPAFLSGKSFGFIVPCGRIRLRSLTEVTSRGSLPRSLPQLLVRQQISSAFTKADSSSWIPVLKTKHVLSWMKRAHKTSLINGPAPR